MCIPIATDSLDEPVSCSTPMKVSSSSSSDYNSLVGYGMHMKTCTCDLDFEKPFQIVLGMIIDTYRLCRAALHGT